MNRNEESRGELAEEDHQRLIDWVRVNKLKLLRDTKLITESLNIMHGHPKNRACNWDMEHGTCSGWCQLLGPGTPPSDELKAKEGAIIAYRSFRLDVQKYSVVTNEILNGLLKVKEEIVLIGSNGYVGAGYIDAAITLENNRVGGTSNASVKDCDFYAYIGALRCGKVLIEAKSHIGTRASVLSQINSYKLFKEGKGYWILIVPKDTLSTEEQAIFVEQKVTPYIIDFEQKA